MLFDVKPILYAPGKQLDFQFALDLSDVEFSGRFPASRPIEVEGCVRNTADVLELELTARTTLDAVCDRCGKAFAQDKEVTYSCLLRRWKTGTATRLFCWRTAKWMWVIWPAPRSSSGWTPKLCVRKIARDCAPGAAPI